MKWTPLYYYINIIMEDKCYYCPRNFLDKLIEIIKNKNYIKNISNLVI